MMITRAQQTTIEQIRAAWNSPIMEGWNPNVSPVVRVSVDPPARMLTTIEATLALPPRYEPPRHVVFTVRTNGRHYAIMGELDGVSIVMVEGEMRRAPAG
jgi:hypothetical protein